MKLIHLKKNMFLFPDDQEDFYGASLLQLQANHILEVESIENFKHGDLVTDKDGRELVFESFCSDHPQMAHVSIHGIFDYVALKELRLVCSLGESLEEVKESVHAEFMKRNSEAMEDAICSLSTGGY